LPGWEAACGTAAVVVSIGKIKSSAGDIVIADGSSGAVTAATRAKLAGIRRGDICRHRLGVLRSNSANAPVIWNITH
jgi:hypothetical protein